MVLQSKNREGWSENKLKGNMAECIVEQMFSEAGYRVFRFGYEHSIQYLKELVKERKLKDNKITERIRSTPDFIAVDAEGTTFLVEVKFRTDWIKWEDDSSILERLYDNWEDVVLIMVSNKEPYFRISTIREYLHKRRLYSLDEFRIVSINKSISEKYESLVKKYFRGDK
jgi:hypothetical protein